jgi:hypothetical protein
MAVCETLPGNGTSEALSFVSSHPRRGHAVSSCQGEDSALRGFIFGGFHFVWGLHWAALDTPGNNVQVQALEIDSNSGDVYVVASITHSYGKGAGLVSLRGGHLHRWGYFGHGGSAGSREEFMMTDDAAPRTLDKNMVYTVLARVSVDGRPQWMTRMESQWRLEAADIRVDVAAHPARILVAGTFQGGPPRFYQVEPTTRLPRDNENELGCHATPGHALPPGVNDLAECSWLEAAGNSATTPLATMTSSSKTGAFVVWYDAAGVARAACTGIHFASEGSSLTLSSIRVAAHSSQSILRRAPDEPGASAHAAVNDAQGMYVAMRVVVSRGGDTLFLGQQAQGWQDIDPCKNGYFEEVASANGTQRVCRDGFNRERDVMTIRFAAAPIDLPDASKDETAFAVLVKFVVLAGQNHSAGEIGSVWTRVIGEVCSLQILSGSTSTDFL